MSDPSTDRSRTLADGISRRALAGAGIFGFGFSGLLDVLLLHLILQWHHLLSGIYPMNTLAGLRTNIAADGWFSVGMVVIAGVGAGIVWRAERRTRDPLAFRPIVGSAVMGLGIFDLYDAVVDHAILGIHQPLSMGGKYNPHWVVVSIVIIGAGAYIYWTATTETNDPAEST